MNLYLAPLEGITTDIYRNAHKESFSGVDAYFAPFITPSDIEKISIKSLRDIEPERNKNIRLIPQVLTRNAESFLKFCEKIGELGYNEVNLNLGCPSSTVVKKGRGAGFLKEPEELDRFFDEIFKKCDFKISVKTRTGFFDSQEIDELMAVYNRYPIFELIVHPRARQDYYRNEINMEAFRYCYQNTKNPICYNGDICTKQEFEKICAEFPDISGVMIGRGAVKNPAIFREISGGERLQTGEVLEFSQKLCDDYKERLKTDVFVLHKLKEVWLYMMQNFPEEKKVLKAIKKANSTEEIKRAILLLPKL